MQRNRFLRQMALITSAGLLTSVSQSFTKVPKNIADDSFLSGENMLGSDDEDSSGANGRSRLKTSLNAYSFNQLLSSGKMKLDELLRFCAAQGFDAVDLTGYYFKDYPQQPSDEYIFQIKRLAVGLGLEISGTGVRNDFTYSDKSKCDESLQLVKEWIDVAAKLGAPVLRVFAGTQEPAVGMRAKIEAQVIDYMKLCAEYGAKKGVIVAMQNHNDFIKTSDDVIKIVEGVKSDWFGLVLDIGSYRTGDPYQQIIDTTRYAVNWQIKENMYINGKEVPTDLNKVISIVRKSGYQGYIPIETLGAGDPYQKVPQMLTAVKKVLKETEN